MDSIAIHANTVANELGIDTLTVTAAAAIPAGSAVIYRPLDGTVIPYNPGLVSPGDSVWLGFSRVAIAPGESGLVDIMFKDVITAGQINAIDVLFMSSTDIQAVNVADALDELAGRTGGISGEMAVLITENQAARAYLATGITLSNAIAGTTTVPKSAFDSSLPAMVISRSLVYDLFGTVGVYTADVDTANITVTTMSNSITADHISYNLGTLATHADLPTTISAGETAFGRTPTLNDYCTVLADETYSGSRVEWYVTDRSTDADPVITWGNEVVLNTGDFQQQTTTQDSGKVLVGGPTPGTFGTSKDIDVEATLGSTNLITSSAAFNTAFASMVPDYANINESVNYITGNISTWTAPKDGYFIINAQSTTSIYIEVTINNVIVIYNPAVTSIPKGLIQVSAGDTIKADFGPSAIILANSFAYYIPPKKVIPPVVDAVFGFPDYANEESTNRITTNNGTWIVTQSGFVHVQFNPNSRFAGDSICYVNDKIVFQAGADTLGGVGNYIPVSAGDVVKMTTTGTVSTTWGCWYTPPKPVPAPVDTVNSPHLWLTDGSEVSFLDGSFGRRFTGTVTAAANTTVDTVLFTSILSITNVLCIGGWCSTVSNNKLILPISFENVQAGVFMLEGEPNSLIFRIRNHTNINNAPYDVWIRYTK